MCELEYPITVCIYEGGPVYSITGYDGKEYRFELPPYCGLGVLNKDDSIRSSPSPRAFWDAVSDWQKQGQQVEDGRCVFERRR